MREHPEQPIFGPENPKLDPPNPPRIKTSRSVAKAISWRTVGTLDTLLLSYVLITYLGPIFGLESESGEALEAASYIAITEVITKMIFYFVHERIWAKLDWGTSIVKGRRKESYKRTTTKSLTWRTWASLDTMLLAYLFTGNIGTAVSIGGLEVITKLVLYFVHERVWSNISFGIVQRPSVPPPEHEPLGPTTKKITPKPHPQT